ncbi:MAG: VTT domain-containing protein [Candidatus Moranbacteria bacterium]|nr:VTT domain-containing protein [Candidatus Moranbacteria bacterium]
MNSKKIFLILSVLAALALIIFCSSYLYNVVLSSIGYLGDYLKENKFFGGILFIGISAFSVLLSPFSSVPLVPSAVLAWGNFLTFLLLFTGWIIGGIVAYLVGSYSREKLIERFVSFEKIEYYKERISPRSQFWLVFFFRLAVPSEVASYTLGIIRYDFEKYLLATILAELPFAIFVIYSSYILISESIFLFAGVLLLGTAGSYFLYRAFQKKIKSQK